MNSNRLIIYEMVIALFQMDDKDEKFCFFKETFLLINISMNITFEILFLMLCNVDVNFNN